MPGAAPCVGVLSQHSTATQSTFGWGFIAAGMFAAALVFAPIPRRRPRWFVVAGASMLAMAVAAAVATGGWQPAIAAGSPVLPGSVAVALDWGWYGAVVISAVITGAAIITSVRARQPESPPPLTWTGQAFRDMARGVAALVIAELAATVMLLAPFATESWTFSSCLFDTAPAAGCHPIPNFSILGAGRGGFLGACIVGGLAAAAALSLLPRPLRCAKAYVTLGAVVAAALLGYALVVPADVRLNPGISPATDLAVSLGWGWYAALGTAIALVAGGAGALRMRRTVPAVVSPGLPSGDLQVDSPHQL